MTFTTGTKLTLVIFLAVVTVVVSIVSSSITAGDLRVITGQADILQGNVEEGRLTQELRLQVANIWQFITDASLTRDRKVIDEEAKPSYDEARKIIDRLIAMNQDDRPYLEKLENIKTSLPAMWETGIGMFEAYQTDWQAGNRLMDDYDKACDKVIKDAAEINEKHKKEMEQAFTSLFQRASDSSARVLVAMALITLIGVTVLLITYIIRRLIMASINNMLKLAAEVEAGNLIIEEAGHATDGDRDEIARLKRSFTRVVHAFHRVVDDVLLSATKLSGSVALLKSRAERTAAGALRQTEQATQITMAAEQMSFTIADISQTSATASEVSEGALQIAQEGKAVAGEAVDAINRVLVSNSDLARMVGELNARVTEIGGVVEVISDIADQTNLLALNAAIEAARAGEQGRGFAVVADEVRELAVRTIKATKEIGTKINAVQQDSQRTAKSMDDASAEVDRATGYIRKVGEALDDVVGEVRTVRDSIVQIATAVEEQSATASAVAANIARTSTIALEMEAMSADVLHEASELTLTSEALRSETAEFRTNGGRFMIFDLAISDHQIFVGKVGAALRGDHGLDPAELPDHHACRLGKWYYSEGVASYGALTSFKAIETPHEQIHAIAKEALIAHGKGNSEHASRQLAEIERISEQIAAALGAIKTECNAG